MSNPTVLPDIAIDAVYFAQTHVQKSHGPFFRLVGNKATLLKVHVVAPSDTKSPAVEATLTLGDKHHTLPLTGPRVLPRSFCGEPGKVDHNFSDCFTATIPGKWIRRGLTLKVTAGDAEWEPAKLNIGPPIDLKMTMLDIHYFGYEDADYPEGWEEEIMRKRPISSYSIQRMKRVLFPDLIIPPRNGHPAVLCHCTDDYEIKTGEPFNGKQNAALEWQRALQAAGGQKRLTLFFISIANVPAGGWAEDFGGVGSLSRFPVLNHELGHCLNVDDLGGEACYAYRGPMYGVDRTMSGGFHVGPVWGYDPRPGLPWAGNGMPWFISPIVPDGGINQIPGEWKGDPMCGGGGPAPEPGNPLKFFSDYSVRRMQDYAEKHIVQWNEKAQSYAKWNDYAGYYAEILKNDGVTFPIEQDVEVYSVIVAVSAVTDEATLIYRLIGPYRSGLIDTFDPALAEDRKRARKVTGFQSWDVSLRFVQGGVTKTRMLPIEWRPEADPLDPASFQTRALNLPVTDGPVTRADVLLTPEAEVNGVPENPRVLCTIDFTSQSFGETDSIIELSENSYA